MELGDVVALLGGLVGLPWLILHYVTKWKTAATLTVDDEEMLDEMYHLARRLETRLETVERLVSSDHPEFRPARLASHVEDDDDTMREIAKMRARKERMPR